MANRFREKPKEHISVLIEEPSREFATPKTKEKKKRKKGVLANLLAWIFSGTFLASDKNVKHVPFIIFLACTAITYIAYGYYADDTIREVNKISNSLKELRSEFIYTKSELMFASKQSEVAKAVEVLGLKEPVTPPMKIEVDSTQSK